MLQIFVPLDWNSPCRGEGASHQNISTQLRLKKSSSGSVTTLSDKD